MPARRVRARVEGTVQGVGFRPFVYRLATELELGGFVLNDERGVVLEVEGPPQLVEQFLARLSAEAPPLAAVERVDARRRPRRPASAASRSPTSEPGAGAEALVSPDMATCDDCLARAVRSRRPPPPLSVHQLHQLRPALHDRPRRPLRPRRLTTMAGFEMCAACRAEYEDPLDRRFHAQPNACPRVRARGCGSLDAAGEAVGARRGPDAVAATAAALDAGRDRRRQGARRLPPRVPRRRRATPLRRCGRESTARTSRSR